MYPFYTTEYKIPKQSQESLERYAYRCWFVSKQKPKTKTELKQAIKWSLIKTNVLYDGCKYPEEVNDYLKRL